MSPLSKYLMRNLTLRPFITLLVVITMTVVGITITGVLGAAGGLRIAFAPPGHDNWVVVSRQWSRTEKDSTLNIVDIGMLTVGNEVKRYSLECVIGNTVVYHDQMSIYILRALEPTGFAMHSWKLLDGRKPEEGKDEVMVGDALLQRFPELHIGNTVRLLDTEFPIVGVFHGDGYQAGELWTTRAALRRDPSRKQLSVIYLETANAEDARAVAARLQGLRAVEVDAVPESRFYYKMSLQYAQIMAGLLSVLFLIVTGSAFCGMSLLVVLQQRRLPELCVLRAVGFRDWKITLMILAEVQLLVLLGGVVGVLIAMYAMQHVTLYAVAFSLSTVTFKAAPTWTHAGFAVAALAIAGVLGALLPIVRMRRTPITRGLREE